jgi:hypothetical protein
LPFPFLLIYQQLSPATKKNKNYKFKNANAFEAILLVAENT